MLNSVICQYHLLNHFFLEKIGKKQQMLKKACTNNFIRFAINHSGLQTIVRIIVLLITFECIMQWRIQHRAVPAYTPLIGENIAFSCIFREKSKANTSFFCQNVAYAPSFCTLWILQCLMSAIV